MRRKIVLALVTLALVALAIPSIVARGQSSNFNWTAICYGELKVIDTNGEFEVECREGPHKLIIRERITIPSFPTKDPEVPPRSYP